MVLSNKKLKQKLRATLTESLVSTATKTENHNPNLSNPDPNSQPQSLKYLLVSATQKPRLSKREKRRKALTSESVQTANALERQRKKEKKKSKRKNNGEEAKTGDTRMEKTKKRKRENDGEEKIGDTQMEKKKKKPRCKKNQMNHEEEVRETIETNERGKNEDAANKVKSEEETKSVVAENGQSGEEVAAKANEINVSQKNGNVANKVYVGGIPYYSTEEDIRSFFESCGTITEVDCMMFPDSGKFRGIALLSFKTEAAAKRALALNGADMGGLYLKIVPYKATQVTKESTDFSPAIVEGYNRVYVGNLSWDITEDDLRSLFSDCSISSLRWGEDKETGEFRGYAHVDFNDNFSLKKALMLDQRVLCGRPVRIRCAVPAKKAVEPKSVPTSENLDAGETVSKSGKNRRKACYECGERGHILSECPKKQAADAKSAEPSPKSIPASEHTDAGCTSSNGGKNKNRTCYDCGEGGHMSLECPKKQAAVSKSTDPSPESVLASANADTGQTSSKNGKKNKNRTCYECGNRGHISSECPKKETADAK